MAKNEMVRQHHQLNGHESEQTPGDSGGLRSLTCCCPWDHRHDSATEQQKTFTTTNLKIRQDRALKKSTTQQNRKKNK